MCGIVALWNRDGTPVDHRVLARAVAALAHRGPDDEGYVLIDTRSGRAVACRGDHAAGPATAALPPLVAIGDHRFDLALGHRRLAIIDTSEHGHQPMADAAGASWLTYNGMIYNFAELRAELAALGHGFRTRTDTEVVLAAYRQWGEGCVERFNGMFAFVLWDGEARRLFAARDRLGIKPLVWRVDDRVTAFASELRALRTLAPTRDEIDPQALHHYLSLMQVPAPYTIYRGLRKLAPAHTVTVAARGHAERQYWRLAPSAGDGIGRDEAVARVDALVRDSVRLRLIADVPAGSLLSGGVDSSIVTALAARERGESGGFGTYSIAVPESAEVDESPWARRVARDLGTDHTEVELRSSDLDLYPTILGLYDEPFAVSSVLGVYLLARVARSRVKVLLSGDGGDELFAGYVDRQLGVDAKWDAYGTGLRARLREDRAMAAADHVRWRERGRAEMRRARVRSLVTSDQRGRDFAFGYRRCMFTDAEKAALYTAAWRDGHALHDTVPWLSSTLASSPMDRLTRRRLHDVTTGLHDEMLAKLDRATMAWGIEGRVPLLDHRLVELAFALPGALHAEEGGKGILKRLGERYVAREVLQRPKQGFGIPLAAWFSGARREWVRDIVSPAAIARTGVFDARVVGEVLATYERRPNVHTAHWLFTLCCYQLWHDARSDA